MRSARGLVKFAATYRFTSTPRGATLAPMTNILGIALIVAMLATVVMLVRGIIAFLRSSGDDIKAGEVSPSSLKQNAMMRKRIAWQAVAIIIVILLLIFARSPS